MKTAIITCAIIGAILGTSTTLTITLIMKFLNKFHQIETTITKQGDQIISLQNSRTKEQNDIFQMTGREINLLSRICVLEHKQNNCRF